MNPVDEFAQQARAYARWLKEGSDTDSEAARTCLHFLLELYRAGLNLPGEPTCDGDDVEVRVEDEEWNEVFKQAGRLPIDGYASVFNPAEDPVQSAITVSLSDDLADIYRDVVTGLRLYDRGHRSEAHWQWSLTLKFHWGAHATSAIDCLHWWLADNAQEGLCAPPDGESRG